MKETNEQERFLEKRKISPGVFSNTARRFPNCDDPTFDKLRDLFAHNVKDWEADVGCWGMLKTARHALLRDWGARFGKVGVK